MMSLGAGHCGLMGLCLWCLSCTPVGEPTKKQMTGAMSESREPGSSSRDETSEADEAPSQIRQDAGVENARGRTAMADAGTSTGTKRAAAKSGEPDARHVPDASSGSTAAVDASSVDDEEMPPERSRDPIPADQMEIAPEIADRDALMRLSDWSKLPIFDSIKTRQFSSENRRGPSESEAALFPILTDGNRDLSNFVCRSANTTLSRTPTLDYVFDMDACPEDYVQGAVLARFEGSGRMRRLYMTAMSFSTSGNALKDEMLRVYVDDNPRPLVQLRLDQIASGAAGEIFTTPFGSVAQNAIAWYYPVSFAKKLVVALDNLAVAYSYAVDAALDGKATPRFAAEKRAKQRDVAHSLLVSDSPLPAATTTRSEPLMLAGNETREITFDGPSTIQQLRLRVPKEQLASLAAVRIAVSWDGASERAIDVPLLGLFAAMRSPAAQSSLALESAEDGADRVLSLRLPMPFRSRASWAVSNTSAAAASFSLEWSTTDGAPSREFGHLHVQLREAKLPLTQITQTIAQARSRGRLVGVCADLGGRAETGFGREWEDPLYLTNGDIFATTDGEQASHEPASDIYVDDTQFFTDTPKATPFVQRWNRVHDTSVTPPGQISFCRWHVLGNEIDFQSELTLSRDAAQRDPTTVDLHRTVAYLYLP